MNIKQKIKEAAEFLGRRGRRIELIFFGLILVFVFFSPLFFYSYTEYLFAKLTDYIATVARLTPTQGDGLSLILNVAALCLSILLAIFVTLPIFSCFFIISIKMGAARLVPTYPAILHISFLLFHWCMPIHTSTKYYLYCNKQA